MYTTVYCAALLHLFAYQGLCYIINIFETEEKRNDNLAYQLSTVSDLPNRQPSAFLPLFFLCDDGRSILHLPNILVCRVGRYRQHCCWMRNLSSIPLRSRCRLSLSLFGYYPFCRRKTCLKVFLLVSERF